MKIKEVARATGLTEKTIRYYENRGLVIPAAKELNGRSFRDYSPEDVSALQAVSTLRKARFPVEEIARMQQKPETIPEVLRDYGQSVEEAYAALGRIRELLKQEDLSSAESIYALAEKLRPATENIPLPKQDLHFRFRQLDKLEAEKREGVQKLPSGFRVGWTTLYNGKDKPRFEDIQTSLRIAGIPFRTRVFTAVERLSAQNMVNMTTNNPYNMRAPQPTNQFIQAKLLSDKSLDSYAIEVRKRDILRANAALRELK